MANETLARRYATAVFSLASDAGAIEQIGKDLTTVLGAIDTDATTKNFFVAPIVDRKEKERVLQGTFEGKIHEIALHTLLLLVRKRRETLLGELVTEYKKLELAARGAEPLVVTTAKELGADELRAMVERLERAYGKKFDVNVKVDPSLIGGVRLTMGDRRIDGSVAGRLEDLTRTLFAHN
ncbi:MAG: ATP synthase F1 subunit delta [bacterium]|nr:ATP synthase F1 subunit delta [bacterium]